MSWPRFGIGGGRGAERGGRGGLGGTGKKKFCFCLSREKKGSKFFRSKSARGMVGRHNISSRGKTGVQRPICRKRSERSGSGRKRRGMHRGSTCARSCFA